VTAPWELRLDRDLWTATGLGTVGPPDLLRGLARGAEMSYRPLLRSHLAAGLLADHMGRAVEVVEDSAAWDALAETPEVARHCPKLGGWDDHTVAVVLRNWADRQFQGVLVAHVGGATPEVAQLRTFWVWNAAWLTMQGADATLGAGFVTLFQCVAHRGAVAVTATEGWTGRRFVQVLRDIAGFRPTREVYAEVGLSAADSAQVLVDWRATVEDGRLVRFATRPTLDEAVQRELLSLLRRYFRHAAGSLGDEPPALAGLRQTFNGEVHIDGPRGWGTGRSDDDWYDGPPDQFPDSGQPFDLAEHARLGPAILARCLEDA
jgi:hypothetical protein